MYKILLLLLLSFILLDLQAQDRVFTYTYQSGVLNKGQKEIEVWSTLANGRTDYYKGLDHSLEFEIGLGHKLQTAFYLNYGYSSGLTSEDGTKSLVSSTDYSFSNEWKIKLTDPMANRLGSALYLEYSIAPTATAVEGKLILDKQMGKFTSAFNLVGEYEVERDFISQGANIVDIKTDQFTFEMNYGLSYRIKKDLNIGFEAFNKNQMLGSTAARSILLAGPSLSYHSSAFWINLTCMPQIANLQGGGLELADNERLQTRLIFSYEF